MESLLYSITNTEIDLNSDYYDELSYLTDIINSSYTSVDTIISHDATSNRLKENNKLENNISHYCICEIPVKSFQIVAQYLYSKSLNL
jgi:tyrosyl-tRNA synthetase